MKKLLLLFTILICSAFSTKAQDILTIDSQQDCKARYSIYVNDGYCKSTKLYTTVYSTSVGPIDVPVPDINLVSYVEVDFECDISTQFQVGKPCSICSSQYPTQIVANSCCGPITLEWQACDVLYVHH